MTDFPQLLFVFLVAVNPASQARLLGSTTGSTRMWAAAWGFCMGAVLLVAATVGAPAFLEFLEVEPETFRIAAGIVIATWGIRSMLPFPATAGEGGLLLRGAIPLGWPGIANPAAIAAALSLGADSDRAGVVFAAVLWCAVAATVALRTAPRFLVAMTWVTVTLGALAAIVGANLIVDGVLAV